jgi:RimJ/RimL family protein N-acetyltransferase
VDVHDVYRVCADDPGIDRVTRYLPWSPHDTPAETRAFLERGRDRFAAGEAADYVLRPAPDERASGVPAPDMAGFGGLTPDWDRGVGALGVWLRRPYWGRGYSAERAFAMADLAFRRLDLDRLVVSHHVDNENSRRAVERYVGRMGGERVGRFRNWRRVGDVVVDEVRYGVDSAAWRAAREAGDVPGATFHDD